MNAARPARRRSGLSTEHPAYGQPAAAPEQPSAPAPAPRASSMEKVTAQVHHDVLDAARNAVHAAILRGEPATLSGFIEDAVDAHTRAAQDEWNGGEPFPQRPRGPARIEGACVRRQWLCSVRADVRGAPAPGMPRFRIPRQAMSNPWQKAVRAWPDGND